MDFFKSLTRLWNTQDAAPAALSTNGGKPTGATASPAPSKSRSGPPSSMFPASGQTAGGGMDARQQFQVRRDLLRLVMRDLLNRNGIPAAWLELHSLAAQAPDRTAGVHARFVLKQWQPRIMEHVRGLEQMFVQRLMALDPLADQWMMGMSWQMAVPGDEAIAPLPGPGSWTLPAAREEVIEPTKFIPAIAAGDVIAGPVHIDQSAQARRAHLDQLFARNDIERAAAGHGSFEATEPAPLQ